MLARILRLLPTKTLDGYEHSELISEIYIYAKTLAASPTGSWPEVRTVKTVLNFGDACGIHYKLAVREQPLIRWAVVETPAMVKQAAVLATDRLRFFDNVASAADWLGSVDLIHASGALQYTPSPIDAVRSIVRVGAQRIEWKRLFLSDNPVVERQRSMMVENGPSFRFSTKAVAYERRSISRAELAEAHSGYSIKASGRDWLTFVAADLPVMQVQTTSNGT